MRRVWGLAVLVVGAVATARADTAPTAPVVPGPNVFYASGSFDELRPGGTGRGAGLGWHHAFSSRVSGDAAVAWNTLAGSRWGYARLGAQLHLSRGVAYAETNLGEGRRANGQFPYRIQRAGVVVPVLPAKLFVDAGDQHVVVDTARGHIVKLAVIGAPRPSLTVEVAAHRSLGGNIGARFASVRLDLRRPKLGGLAGLVFGRSRPEIIAALPARVPSTQAYVGLRVPTAAHDLTLVLSTLKVDTVSRHGLELAWTWHPAPATRE